MRFIKTRPAIKAAPSVGRFVSGVFADLAKTTKYIDPKLAIDWPRIVGDETAKLCRPGRLTGGHLGKTLEVFARNSAAGAKIQFEQEAIRQKVNMFLGPDTVARLSIIHKEEPKSAAATSPKDDALGTALSRFRSSVAQKADKN